MKRWLAFTVLLLLAGGASASFIRLSSTLTVESLVLSGDTVVNVTIVNEGDEPAYSVVLSLGTPDGISSAPLDVGTLYPNEPYEGFILVAVDESLPSGRYPIVYTTNYADANSYPFSTVSLRFLNVGAYAPIIVHGVLSPVELSGGEEKEMKLTVRNLNSIPHDVLVRVHAPNEIKVVDPQRTLSVAGQSESETSFKVSSFGALGGSTYVVAASMSFERAGLAHAGGASSFVTILKDGEDGSPQAPSAAAAAAGGGAESGGIERNQVILILGVFLAGLILVEVARKRKAGKKK